MSTKSNEELRLEASRLLERARAAKVRHYTLYASSHGKCALEGASKVAFSWLQTGVTVEPMVAKQETVNPMVPATPPASVAISPKPVATSLAVETVEEVSEFMVFSPCLQPGTSTETLRT